MGDSSFSAAEILNQCQENYQEANNGILASLFSSQRNILGGVSSSIDQCQGIQFEGEIHQIENYSHALVDHLKQKEYLDTLLESQFKLSVRNYLLATFQYQGKASGLSSFLDQYPEFFKNEKFKNIYLDELSKFKSAQAQNFIEENLKHSDQAIANEMNQFALGINQVCEKINSDYIKANRIDDFNEREFYKDKQEEITQFYESYLLSSPHAKLINTRGILLKKFKFDSKLGEKCSKRWIKEYGGGKNKRALREGTIIPLEIFKADVSSEDVGQAKEDYLEVAKNEITGVHQNLAKINHGDVQDQEGVFKELLSYRPYLFGELFQGDRSDKNLAFYLCEKALEIYKSDEWKNIAEISVGAVSLVGAVAVGVVPGVGPLVSGAIMSKVLAGGAAGVIAVEGLAITKRYEVIHKTRQSAIIGLQQFNSDATYQGEQLTNLSSEFTWIGFDAGATLLGLGSLKSSINILGTSVDSPLVLKPVHRVNASGRAATEMDLRAIQLNDLSDEDILDLMSVPKANPLEVKVGNHFSVVNDEGHLINARVLSVDGDEVVVEMAHGLRYEAMAVSMSKKIQVDKTSQKVVTREDLYQMIDPSSRIFLSFEDNTPEVFKGLPVGVRLEDLKLKPRQRTATSGVDNAVKISDELFKSIREEVTSLGDLFAKEGESLEFIQRNNKLIGLLRAELKKQGVSMTLFESNKGSLSLRLSHVESDGNRVARLYKRLAERFGSDEVTFSLVDVFKVGSAAFNYSEIKRTELGPVSLVRMLKGEKSSDAFHEFRHQWFSWRRYNQEFSSFDASALADSRYTLDGDLVSVAPKTGYHLYQSFEESYNYAKDLQQAVRGIEQLPEALLKSRLDLIKKVVKVLENVSSRAARVAEEFADSTREVVDMDIVNGFLEVKSVEGNIIRIPAKKFEDIMIMGKNHFEIPSLLNDNDFTYLKSIANQNNRIPSARILEFIGKIQQDSSVENVQKVATSYRGSFNWMMEVLREKKRKELVEEVLQTLENYQNIHESIEFRAIELDEALVGINPDDPQALIDLKERVFELSVQIRNGL